MKPEDELLVRQIALSLLDRQDPAGEGRPPEIVITYRKHEDYERFICQIAELTEKVKRLDQQLAVMQNFASENIRLYDQLRWAYTAMVKAGMDTSFITSVRPIHQPKSKPKRLKGEK